MISEEEKEIQNKLEEDDDEKINSPIMALQVILNTIK